MPNMSYCRFQNTLLALKDCRDNLLAGDLSKEEFKAMKHLIEVARYFADLADKEGITDSSFEDQVTISEEEQEDIIMHREMSGRSDNE